MGSARRGFSHLETVVGDCRLLLRDFDVFEFCFVRRTGNFVADALAKLVFRLGCMVWIEETPLKVSSQIQHDVLASEDFQKKYDSQKKEKGITCTII